MENQRLDAATHEQACARVAARFRPRWLRHYVSSKLRWDPVFADSHEILRKSREPVLDVGCGIGLLALYLRERGIGRAFVGVDLDERKVRAGVEIARTNYSAVELRVHDLRNPLPAFRGSVSLLDVLHYLEPSRQESLLNELAVFISPGGVLVLRDCPRDRSLRYWFTRAGEIFAQAISWNLKRALHFPSRALINAAFPESEFTRAETPSWGGTPFNNRLFVFQRKMV